MTIFVESNDGFNPFSSCVEACPRSSHPQSSFQTHSPEIYPPDTTISDTDRRRKQHHL